VVGAILLLFREPIGVIRAVGAAALGATDPAAVAGLTAAAARAAVAGGLTAEKGVAKVL
jgi:hypothetical protein